MYNWKNKTTKLLRILRASLTAKKKVGWERGAGAGFIAEDILNYDLLPDKTIRLKLFDAEHPHVQLFKASDFNLRETEELIKYLESKEG